MKLERLVTLESVNCLYDLSCIQKERNSRTKYIPLAFERENKREESERRRRRRVWIVLALVSMGMGSQISTSTNASCDEMKNG